MTKICTSQFECLHGIHCGVQKSKDRQQNKVNLKRYEYYTNISKLLLFVMCFPIQVNAGSILRCLELDYSFGFRDLRGTLQSTR